MRTRWLAALRLALPPWSGGRARPRGDVKSAAAQYLGRVSGSSGQAWQADEVRLLVPIFAFAVAVVAALTDPTSALNAALIAIPVAAFASWALVSDASLAVVTITVLVPVVVVQHSGGHEPLMFEVSVLAFVVGRWVYSLPAAAVLGLLALAAPVLVAVIEAHGNVAVGIWILGIAFPWLIARAILRQGQLAAQLEATRRELMQQTLLEERRRISRDVHDLVGHGLAGMMLQVTSARHVLRRDPDAAEEALRSAEEVGRRSMQELRRTVALLRSDDEPGVLPPVPSAADITTLVVSAREAGLVVELRARGDVSAITPGVGLAVYRIAQEALANAARHAPGARTVLGLELVDGYVALVADTAGPTVRAQAGEMERPRYGLVGMRERASALGGELEAGPTAEGWRVSCRLPLPAGDETPGEAAGAG
jgi:signal transduction histidine kinase